MGLLIGLAIGAGYWCQVSLVAVPNGVANRARPQSSARLTRGGVHGGAAHGDQMVPGVHTSRL